MILNIPINYSNITVQENMRSFIERFSHIFTQIRWHSVSGIIRATNALEYFLRSSHTARLR